MIVGIGFLIVVGEVVDVFLKVVVIFYEISYCFFDIGGVVGYGDGGVVFFFEIECNVLNCVFNVIVLVFDVDIVNV